MCTGKKNPKWAHRTLMTRRYSNEHEVAWDKDFWRLARKRHISSPTPLDVSYLTVGMAEAITTGCGLDFRKNFNLSMSIIDLTSFDVKFFSSVGIQIRRRIGKRTISARTTSNENHCLHFDPENPQILVDQSFIHVPWNCPPKLKLGSSVEDSFLNRS